MSTSSEYKSSGYAEPLSVPAPKNLIATPSCQKVTLSWSAIPGADITYEVYYAIASNAYSSTPSVSGLTSPTTVISGLSNLFSYKFKVIARSFWNGYGPFSSELIASPTTPPVAPIFVSTFGNYSIYAGFYAATNNRIYLGGQGFGGPIKVINPTDNSEVTTFSLTSGGIPFGFAYCPINDRIYAGTGDVIRPSDHAIVAVATGLNSTPREIVYVPTVAKLFVVDYLSGIISIINPATNAVVATVSAGSGAAHGIAYCPSNDCIYTTRSGSGFPGSASVGVASSAGLPVTTIALPNVNPSGIAYCPYNDRLYVVHGSSSGNNVSVINPATNTVESTFAIIATGSHVIYNPSNTLLYFTSFNDGKVTVIDPCNNSVSTILNCANSPALPAYNSNNTRVYVPTANAVSIFT